MVTKNTINFSEIDNPTLPIADDVLFIALQLDTSGNYRDVKVTRRDMLSGQVQTWLGAWQSDVEYSAFDCVSYQGSSYIAIATSVGTTPDSDDTLWNIFAKRGDQGIDGDLSEAANSTISNAISLSTAAVSTSQANASAAGTSASTASTAAATATQMAAEASTYASQSQANKNDAGTQAAAATAAALNASAASNSVSSSLRQFKTFFIGSFDTDPQTDGNGNALVAGAVYINTTTGKLRVYFDSVWADYDADYQQANQDATAAAAAAAASASNSAVSATSASNSATTATAQATSATNSATTATAQATSATASAASAASSAKIAADALVGSTSAAENLIGSFVGVIVSNQRILKAITPNAITLPKDLEGSYAYCDVAPTADVVCPINLVRAGTTIPLGTVNFPAGYVVGTFTFANETTTLSGDIVEIRAPATSDVTFTGPAFGLACRVAVFDGYVTESNTAYTLSATDRSALIVLNSTDDMAMPLPTATGNTGDFPNGWKTTFLNTGTKNVTITVNSGDSLNGVVNGSIVLANLQHAEVRSGGSSWFALVGG